MFDRLITAYSDTLDSLLTPESGRQTLTFFAVPPRRESKEFTTKNFIILVISEIKIEINLILTY